MMSRAEIVDILICRAVPEAMAWEIAMSLKPEYLEAVDETALRRDADELVQNYLNGTQEFAERCPLLVNRKDSGS